MQKRANHPSSELQSHFLPSSEAIHSKIGELEKNRKQEDEEETSREVAVMEEFDFVMVSNPGWHGTKIMGPLF